MWEQWHAARIVQLGMEPDRDTGMESTVESGCIRGSGRILSLTEAGLFVATPLAFSVGTRVVVGFSASDGSPVRLSGRVSSRATLRGREGLGVRFGAAIPGPRLRSWLSRGEAAPRAVASSDAAARC